MKPAETPRYISQSSLHLHTLGEPCAQLCPSVTLWTLQSSWLLTKQAVISIATTTQTGGRGLLRVSVSKYSIGFHLQSLKGVNTVQLNLGAAPLTHTELLKALQALKKGEAPLDARPPAFRV